MNNANMIDNAMACFVDVIINSVITINGVITITNDNIFVVKFKSRAEIP